MNKKILILLPLCMNLLAGQNDNTKFNQKSNKIELKNRFNDLFQKDLDDQVGSEDIDPDYDSNEVNNPFKDGKVKPIDIVELLNMLGDKKQKPKKVEEKFLSPYSNQKLEDLPVLKSIFKKGIPYELAITIERLKRRDLSQRKHGLIFYGPPGTGKTTTAELIGRACGRRVVFCNGSDFINKYQGSGAEGIKGIFDYAKSLNQPVVIVIDEIDAASAKKKDTGDNIAVANTSNDMTTQLINQMNLIEDNHDIFVVGTTNHEDIIEGAIKSRFDFIKINNPDLEQRISIIKHHLNKNGFEIGKIEIKDAKYLYISESTVTDLAKCCDGWDCRNVMTGVTNGIDAFKYDIEMHVTKSILRKLAHMPKIIKMKNKTSLEKYLYKSFEDQEDKLLSEKSFYSLSNFQKELKKSFVPNTTHYFTMAALGVVMSPINKLFSKGFTNLGNKYKRLSPIIDFFNLSNKGQQIDSEALKALIMRHLNDLSLAKQDIMKDNSDSSV